MEPTYPTLSSQQRRASISIPQPVSTLTTWPSQPAAAQALIHSASSASSPSSSVFSASLSTTSAFAPHATTASVKKADILSRIKLPLPSGALKKGMPSNSFGPAAQIPAKPVYSTGPSASVTGPTSPTPFVAQQLQTTGIAYHIQMLSHERPETSVNPEAPKRIKECMKVLSSKGLKDRCHRVNIEPATREQLLLVHSKRLVSNLEASAVADEDVLKRMNLDTKDDEIFFTPDTAACAKMACGAVISSCKAVLNGTLKNAFALVRPPGHHADPDRSIGYCHINNVAIASQELLSQKLVDRVMIVDWDIHHGNGTQKHFYNNPNCLYFSIHGYNNAQFYPYSPEAYWDRTGAAGRNINVPWSEPGGLGDLDYLYVLERLLIPAAREFDPQMIIVSAGFDAAVNDVGQCLVSPGGFAQMTRALMNFADGKIVLVLEGGIHIPSLTECVAACVSALLGDPIPSSLKEPPVSKETAKTVQAIMSAHRKFWKCFDTPDPKMGPKRRASVSSLNNEIDKKVAKIPLPTLEYPTSYDTLSHDISDVTRFYYRCMWISLFKLSSFPMEVKPSTRADSVPFKFEVLQSSKQSSAALHVFLLDKAFSVVGDRVRDGASGYFRQLSTSGRPFLALDLDSRFKSCDDYAVENVLVELWEKLIVRDLAPSKVILLGAGVLGCKLASKLVDISTRAVSGYTRAVLAQFKVPRVVTFVRFGYNFIPPPLPRTSGLSENQFIFVGGSAVEDAVTRKSQLLSMVFELSCEGLAELMISKQMDVFACMAAE